MKVSSPPEEWATIDDAAARVDRSIDVIRRWVFERRVRASIVEDGRTGRMTYRVAMADVTAAAGAEPSLRMNAATPGETGILLERYRYLEQSFLEKVRAWTAIEAKLEGYFEHLPDPLELRVQLARIEAALAELRSEVERLRERSQ